MDTSKAAAVLGRRGGKAGTGAAKVRGDSEHYRRLRGRAVVYNATWRDAIDSPEPPPDLPARASLSTISGLCQSYGLSAELTDEQGFVRGRVKADGSYSLS